MIKQDKTGVYLLSFEELAEIRRIPVPYRGVSRKGNEYVLGGVLVEIIDREGKGSAQLYLTTFSEELLEEINMIGVGKRVIVEYHLENKEYFDSYKTNVILDGIRMQTKNENFAIGKGTI